MLRAALFARQPAEHSGGFTAEDLIALGASVGITVPAYIDAVRNQLYAPWARTIDDRAGRDGNAGTPELLLDGLVLEPSVLFDPQRLAAALAEEVRRAAPAGAVGKRGRWVGCRFGLRGYCAPPAARAREQAQRPR